MLDVFNNNAFGVVALTDAINRPVFAPGHLGQMGLFTERGVSTTTIVLEQKGGNLILVAPTPRGGPGVTFPAQLQISGNGTDRHESGIDRWIAQPVRMARRQGQRRPRRKGGQP